MTYIVIELAMKLKEKTIHSNYISIDLFLFILEWSNQIMCIGHIHVGFLLLLLIKYSLWIQFFSMPLIFLGWITIVKVNRDKKKIVGHAQTHESQNKRHDKSATIRYWFHSIRIIQWNGSASWIWLFKI